MNKSSRVGILSVTILLSLVLALLVNPFKSTHAASTLAQAGAQNGKGIGTGITANLVNNSTVTNIVRTQFDVLTPGNEMKWDTTEPSQNNFNFGPADRIVNFAQINNIKMRGHTLVWHSQLPGWVSNINGSSALLAVMNNHITTEMTHYKGKIWYWDVVNEAFNENGTRRSSPFQNQIGNAFIEDAFRTARATDPNAKLCYNDYNIEDANYSKTLGVYAMVQDFKTRGVPIDCVGFQSHFIVGQIPNFQATLQKFANLGIDVQITELDDRMPLPPSTANLNQQATDYANIAKACLAVTRCTDITVWGVGEADSWIPSTFPGQGQGLLYDQNYQPKPAYFSYLAALGGSGNGSTATPVPTTRATNTPNPGVTSTPTVVVPTRTPGTGGGTCSPVNATISAPFSFDGVGNLCWRSNSLGSYINSWNLGKLSINGVDFTNKYGTNSQLPAKSSDGYWYISYSSTVAWGHFEAK